MRQTLIQSRGVIMVFLVLIIGSVSLASAAILARGSLGGLVDAASQNDAFATRAEILGCLDEVLIHMQKDDTYAPETVFVGSATCDLAVTTPGAGQRSISLTLTEGDVTRRLKADVTLSPFAVTQVVED